MFKRFKPKYYISGPMFGKPKHNFPLFNKVEAFLVKQGFEVINPAKFYEGPAKDQQERFRRIRNDIKVILDTPNLTGIVLLPDWNTSTGAKAELYVAQELMHCKVYEYIEYNKNKIELVAVEINHCHMRGTLDSVITKSLINQYGPNES